MDKTQYIKEFNDLFALNIDGSGTAPEGLGEEFYKLGEMLKEANKIHNLTAIKEDKEIILKHFIDSLMISEYIPNGAGVIDVGCGAGFPSLPLAIFRQDISLLSIDSTAKKINYVNQTAKALGLENIQALACRAEELAHQNGYRESFDVATARAVAALPILTELCLPFVKLGGSFVAMKSQSAEDELKLAASAIEKCGGKVVDVIEKKLVRNDLPEADSRTIIIIEKTKATPSSYPRIYSKISKKPL